MKKPKVIKVTVEYENKFMILEGKEAQEWRKVIGKVCAYCDAHTDNPPFIQHRFPWKTLEKGTK